MEVSEIDNYAFVKERSLFLVIIVTQSTYSMCPITVIGVFHGIFHVATCWFKMRARITGNLHRNFP